MGFYLTYAKQVGREKSFNPTSKNEISSKSIRKGFSWLAPCFKGGSKAGNL